MHLNLEIQNIKGIKKFNFSFPLERGLYAITGENGSGKTTLITSASTLFFEQPFENYLSFPNDGKIYFDLEENWRHYSCNGQKWEYEESNEKINLLGFFEGSVLMGNRFRENNYSQAKKLDKVKKDELIPASSFVTNNLGIILHNDINFYCGLKRLNKKSANLLRAYRNPFFFISESENLISQPRMSTGENLLLCILGQLEKLQNKRSVDNSNYPCIVLLDEIELALHSSALRRLIIFLKKISEDLNLSIYFSTHSLELLREIKPQNIFYLTKYNNGSIITTNPCYPAYATRNLYGDDGYGNDLVILVEDDLAKLIIEKILREKRIAQNIRIKVLPTGGWTNTLTMAYDVTTSRLLQNGTKLAVVLDRDIEKEVSPFISHNKYLSGIKYDFLPITSLEKFLYYNLIENIDSKLFSELDTYLFQKRPLKIIIDEYLKKQNELKESEEKKSEKTGKDFYGVLLNEVRSMSKDREEIVEIVLRYVFEINQTNIEELAQYLKRKIDE